MAVVKCGIRQRFWGAFMPINLLPPLAIHFVWNPADKELVCGILNSVRSAFARDVDRPFSRGLNIPLFFYSSSGPNEVPNENIVQRANKDIAFIFTSSNTLGRPLWKSYIDSLPESEKLHVIPLAIGREGLGHGVEGRLRNLNFLRSYEWEGELLNQRAVMAMAHEIYRFGFVEVNGDVPGNESSIKIFLSHSKAGDTGLRHAEEIYRFIDNTNMSRFFDAIEISPGFKFDEEIIKHIRESTLVAIGSDVYSSRYWCQREVLCAKEYQRPIVAVDCLKDFEDRIFPAGANVPCVHVSPDLPISQSDILRILNASIIETIRILYAKKSLEYYQAHGWIDEDCVISPRPPEIRQVINIKKEGKKKICYPEPALYAEEAGWLSYFGIEAFTPLWSRAEDEVLKDLRIGISISENPLGDYSSHHLHTDHLRRLSQDLARHLLARAGIVIYGGDLRNDGFTQLVLDEAIALRSRLNSDSIYVENHLAWPIFLSDTELSAWRAKYNSVIKTVEYDVPDDIKESIEDNVFISPIGVENKYVWSRSLTLMRERSIGSSHARICAGGRLSGYNGKMPGVLEEIVISLKEHKPLFLIGAFGGVVGEVCDSIKNKSITAPITEAWQVENNLGYGALQGRSVRDGKHADYEEIKLLIERVSVSELAALAGLTVDEYKNLMESAFVDECVHLVVKGLKKLKSQ